MSGINKSEIFKRQITLSEIGEKGQQKLQDAKVLVVGCGGLGSPIGVYLASSGIGKLHLVDFDRVEITNLHRQVFYSLDDLGHYKSKTLATYINKRAPFTSVDFSTESVTKENVLALVSQYDIVVEATDSLATKYLLNDACVIQGKPLVYGSLYKFDGYVCTFNHLQDDGTFSGNLRDVFPKMNVEVPNCSEAGTLNAIVGMIATAQVNEVLKILTGTGKPLANEMLIYNALQNTQLKMKFSSEIGKNKIQSLFKTHTYFDVACSNQRPMWQISPDELKKILLDKQLSQNFILISVLPNLDLPFKVHQTIPIHEFDVDNFKIDTQKTYIMICQRGLNSYKATEHLKEKYPTLNVLSLTGGIQNY